MKHISETDATTMTICCGPLRLLENDRVRYEGREAVIVANRQNDLPPRGATQIYSKSENDWGYRRGLNNEAIQ